MDPLTSIMIVATRKFLKVIGFEAIGRPRCDARWAISTGETRQRRIGIPPVRRLFEVLAVPLGQRRTPGIMFGGDRTASFDGCKSVKVPDADGIRAWLGKQKATGYPVIALTAWRRRGPGRCSIITASG